MEDIRFEGQAKRLRTVMTAVVVDGLNGKEYRQPTEHEIEIAKISETDLASAYAVIPFGLPREPLPSKEAPGIRVPLYGFTEWADLFTTRQLLTLAVLMAAVRQVKEAAVASGYPEAWGEALWAYLALAIDRQADYGSAVCSWHNSKEQLRNTFGRFALPIVWDYTETNPLSGLTGDFLGALDWIGRVVSRGLAANSASGGAVILQRASAIKLQGQFDAIVTDPPYYDAIPYSDLMDFFYVWLRRTVHGLSTEADVAFSNSLGPKWDNDAGDGELIDDSSRFGGNRVASKKNFEDGMAAVFRRCSAALTRDGILVIVFANKNPDA
jgi:adenine-specific DNA methylase